MTTGNLAIEDNDTVDQYVSVGESVFAFSFPVLFSSELKVSADQVLLTYGGDYTIAGLGDEGGGTITLIAGPSTPGTIYTLWQDMPVERLTGFSPGAAVLLAEALNAEFAARLRVEQQLRREIRNSLRIAPDDPLQGQDMVLPKNATRAGKYLAFDALGAPYPASGTGNDSALRTDLAKTVVGASGSQLIGFRRPEAGSVAEDIYSIMLRQVRLVSFGADNTGVADCTAAFNAAIAACVALNHSTLWVDHGMYRFASAPARIGYGIKIVGPGSQGSTEPYGCVFQIDFAGADFLVWDGNGADARGTGGGLEHVYINVKTGRAANRGIYVLATNDNRRPGEMMFRDVLLFGSGTGSFSTGIEVDGSACNTPGGQGVRTTHWEKVRVCTCRNNNAYVVLTQATHVYGDIEVDTAGGAGTLGITIGGFWDEIHLQLRCGGNVIVNHTGAFGVDIQKMTLSGTIGALDVNYASVIGTANIVSTTAPQNASIDFAVRCNLGDAFFASRSATVTNQTGNATIATMVADSENFDQASSYDNTTGLHTVRCAGKYHYEGAVTMNALAAGNTSGSIFMAHRDSGGSLKSSFERILNVGAIRNATNNASMPTLSAILRCAEGDTVRVLFSASNGGADTVGLLGSAGTRYSYFAGQLQ